jgi:hypothetical protein
MSPGSSWLHNHAYRRASLSPSRFPSICRCQVHGAERGLAVPKDEITGVKSYPSVTDLPEAPDVVDIVVPYDQVLDVLQESHRKGTGSAIVISAGFAERGVEDRRDLQRELGAFPRASGMRISGPNCLGLANVKHDIWATSSSRGASGLTGPLAWCAKAARRRSGVNGGESHQ